MMGKALGAVTLFVALASTTLMLVVVAAGTTLMSGASFSSSSTNPTNGFSAKADWVSPTSSASSPANVSSTTIAVTYTSGDAGSGVASVELWVKGPGDSSYSLADTDSTPASPSFSYTASAGDGTYSFYTRAKDAANNYEEAPGTADSTTQLTSSADTAKPSSSADSPTAASTSPFTVAYTASDAGGSGVASVELWVKRPGDSSYSLAATDTTPASPSFSYTPNAGTGTYRFYTRAKDVANNYEDAPAAEDLATIYETTKPVSSATALSGTYRTSSPFTVSYTASDTGGSGLKEVELWVKRPGDSSFSLVDTDTTPTTTQSFGYAPDAGDGTYFFYTRARDNADNYENAPGGSSGDTSTIFDPTKPSSQAASSSAYDNSSPIAITYSAADGSGSGVDRVELWVRKPADSTYSLSATDTSPGSPSFNYSVPGDTPGIYRFYTRAYDEAGNYEDAPATPPDVSVTFDKQRPSPTDVQGTASPNGTMGAADSLTMTFDEAISSTSISSAWTDPASPLAASVLIDNNGSSDIVTIPSLNFGTVDTKRDYVTGDVTFGSSTLSFNGAQTVLTLTLGGAGTPSGNLRTGLTFEQLSFDPDDDMKDLAGNLIQNSVQEIKPPDDVDF